MSASADLSARRRPGDERAAANIRAELARQRRTAASLARDLGISERQFRQRTRNEVPFTAGELADVARALGVTVESLVAE